MNDAVRMAFLTDFEELFAYLVLLYLLLTLNIFEKRTKNISEIWTFNEVIIPIYLEHCVEKAWESFFIFIFLCY